MLLVDGKNSALWTPISLVNGEETLINYSQHKGSHNMYSDAISDQLIKYLAKQNIKTLGEFISSKLEYTIDVPVSLFCEYYKLKPVVQCMHVHVLFDPSCRLLFV